MKCTAYRMVSIALLLITACGSTGNSSERYANFMDTEGLVIFESEEVDTKPEIRGGIFGMMRGIRYPEEARRASVEGTVVLSFVIDRSGDVYNIEVVQGIGHGCDEEAMRIASKTTFNPAIKNGDSVAVYHSIPIEFRLSGPSF